ncbi:FIST N-terminal domain-containing protein [Rhodoblastus sp.]|uniref:FIST N-terminal domain-containing protein n=1 Tax=Rhodoblastus sp. TaxID=1962975 RepID=UPI003F9CA4C7
MRTSETRADRLEGVVVVSASAENAEAAARDIAALLRNRLADKGETPETALAGLICFVCASYDTATFAAEIHSCLPDIPIYGCTTAGELTLSGWASNSVVAIGFLRQNFTIVAHMLEQLSHFGVEEGRAAAAEARAALMAKIPESDTNQCFGMLLIDGMCRREEAVISALYSAFDDIPVIGGSAGDSMSFEKTWMIRDGAIHRDAALLLLFHTDIPFSTFKSDYFEPTSHKMVVTEADIEQRVVRELNAEPAAQEYARQVGLIESSLDAASFASHPVLVGVGGQYYARSIQKVNADGSLSFFCAIDEGLVLTVAKSLDPYASTLATFERMEAELGAVSLYIGFDCVLRRLAAERSQIAHRLSDLYRAHRVVGFNTYGEQYRSMHVNQTFTGIALGYRDDKERPS